MLHIIFSVYHHLSRRRRIQFFLVLTLMLFNTLAEVFTLGAIVPFLGLLVNPGVADQNMLIGTTLDAVVSIVGGSRLTAASLLFIAFAFVAAALRLTLNWASLRYVFSVGADLGTAIYSRVLQQPYTYHIQHNSSSMIAAVEKIGMLVMGFMAPLMQASIATVMVVSIFGAMMWANPIIAAGAVVVFGGLYGGISAWARNRLRANAKIISNNSSEKIKALQEGLGGIRDVIIDGNYELFTKYFSVSDRCQRLAQANNLLLSSAPKYLVESVGIVLFVMLALWLVTSRGGISHALPTLGALALGAQRLLPYMQNIYNGISTARGNIVAAEETLSMMNLSLRVPALVSADFLLEPKTILVELRSVKFSYTIEGPLVLKSIDLQIRRGSRVGFVGATGCGKSTLTDVIMGLLFPTEGEIIVNGHPLNTNNINVWQSRVACAAGNFFS
ncbi:MAG: ABC transporter ATP-binding protein [Comamonadaceae bacterium]|nr:ABC transporter ATP-binding protein [Comamonadaceae bacterium]